MSVQTINISTDQLHLILMMYKMSEDQTNRTFEEVRFNFQLICPECDPEEVITSLSNLGLVELQEEDYVITPKGRALCKSKTQFNLRRLARAIVQEGLGKKLINLILNERDTRDKRVPTNKALKSSPRSKQGHGGGDTKDIVGMGYTPSERIESGSSS